MQAGQRPWASESEMQSRISWYPFERIWEDSRARNPGIYRLLIDRCVPLLFKKHHHLSLRPGDWSYIIQVTVSAQRQAAEQSRHQDIANDTVRHMRICSSSSTLENTRIMILPGGAYKRSLHHLKIYSRDLDKDFTYMPRAAAYTACNLQLQPLSTLLNLMFVLHHPMVQLLIISRDWSIAGRTQGIKLRLYQI